MAQNNRDSRCWNFLRSVKVHTFPETAGMIKEMNQDEHELKMSSKMPHILQSSSPKCKWDYPEGKCQGLNHTHPYYDSKMAA